MWLLDTNVLSEVIRKRPHAGLLRRLRAIPPDRLYSSVICRYELRYGALLRDDGPLFWSKLETQVIPLVRWLEMDMTAADRAGFLCATLERQGKSIDLHDALIAATAMENDFVLVTRNMKHFASLPGLRVENWFEENS